MGIKIGISLLVEDKTWLVELLRKYIEIFAWVTINMLRIDLKVACYKLSIDPSIKPIKRRNHGVK